MTRDGHIPDCPQSLPPNDATAPDLCTCDENMTAAEFDTRYKAGVPVEVVVEVVHEHRPLHRTDQDYGLRCSCNHWVGGTEEEFDQHLRQVVVEKGNT